MLLTDTIERFFYPIPRPGRISRAVEVNGVQNPKDFVAFYDERKAQKYPTGTNPENDAVVHRALRSLKLRSGEVLMDFGCADGYFTQRLAEAVAGIRAVGFDLVPHDSWQRLQSDGVSFFSGMLPTPLAPASVDAIFCSQVLEHVPDPLSVAQEFRRVLRPAGRVWLATPNSYEDTARAFHALQRHVDSAEGHIRHFGARDIEELFSPLGFELTAVRYDTFFALYLYYRFIAFSPLKALLMPFVAPEIAAQTGPTSATQPKDATRFQITAKEAAFSILRAARRFDEMFSSFKYGQILEVTMTRPNLRNHLSADV